MTRPRIFIPTLLSLVFLLASLAGPLSAAAQRLSPAAAATPVPALAVIISEVAWAGTMAADEVQTWIELYNPGLVEIDLSGWSLSSSDTDPNITFPAGKFIPAGGFFLLEANDDQTVSDIPANLIYTGVLSFGGEVLTLKDPAGNIVDTANSGLLTGWYAGSAPPLSSDHFSMERVGLVADGKDAWATNDGIHRNGLDSGDISGNNKNPINGTPKQYYFSWPPTPTPPTPSETATLTFTSTASDTATYTASVTATPRAPVHVVISEFRTAGPKGAEDEFVELFNPTGAAVSIGSWGIKRSAACGSTVSALVTIRSGTILQAGQHYLLLSATNSSFTGADQVFSPAIADDGGLALTSTSGTIVDQVGMCDLTQYHEGTVLAPLAGPDDQSYERKPGGETACYDTDNNSNDFDLIFPAAPQNKSSPVVLCSGVPLSTPTSTPTRTATRTATPRPTTIPATVVLNEFLPHPHSDWNEDGSADTKDEYIEIINMGVIPVDIHNWKLANAISGGDSYSLPELTLLPRQIARYYTSESGVDLSNGGGTVRLVRADGRTSDIQNYPVVSMADRTWCRLPDGNGVWNFGCVPTPGRPNARSSIGTPVPLLPVWGQGEKCPLLEILPGSFLLAECGAPGSAIVNPGTQVEFWLQTRWKFDIYLD